MPKARCLLCALRRSPGGLMPGYCGGGRDDLPPAYGQHPPLRELPADKGESCEQFQRAS